VAQAKRPSIELPDADEQLQQHRGVDISEDEMFEMLANRRRRYTIHYLKEREEQVDLGTLAEHVGAWEYDTTADQLSAAERKTVYTALQQRHLPKMDDAGIIDFDKRAGTVRPTEALTDLEIYAEVVGSGEFPWNQYYLGLSIGMVAVMVAVWANVYPLVLLPDIAWGFFAAVAFTFSAIAHVVVSRDMKLGFTEDPPEVK
jgi:hypothetical protein